MLEILRIASSGGGQDISPTSPIGELRDSVTCPYPLSRKLRIWIQDWLSLKPVLFTIINKLYYLLIYLLIPGLVTSLLTIQ